MGNRALRIASVLLAAGVMTQACMFTKKKTGTGTNLGSSVGSGDDLPPPGQPSLHADER